MITKLFAWWFTLKGWKVGGNIPPDVHKAVVLAAPHTSNWDFVYALATFRILGLKVNYLAKKELFRFPLKYVIEGTGGIPVERSKSHNLVDAMINAFHSKDRLYLLAAAEGTRKKVTKWKSGFYHVAMGAGVPVMLGYLDYEKKVAGFGPVIHLTGDKEKDMAAIREFYRHIRGRNPEKFDPESVRIA
jgi:1-acyl-sn-glycerol-3-phosphate acyltransferase